jgi:hypothetical protein
MTRKSADEKKKEEKLTIFRLDEFYSNDADLGTH